MFLAMTFALIVCPSVFAQPRGSDRPTRQATSVPPPVAIPAPPAPAPTVSADGSTLTKTYYSDDNWSGEGMLWSEWYTLRIPAVSDRI